MSTTSTDTTQNKQTLNAPATDPAAGAGVGEGTKPPVGATVDEAAQAASQEKAPAGLDADADTAGRVDEPQATTDRENAAGYRGIRTDPTPHSHYTIEGVTAGKPTPETNAAAALLSGNRGRFLDLDDDTRDEHHSAEGVDEIAARSQKLRLV